MKLEYLQNFSSRRNKVRLARTEGGELVIHKEYASLSGMEREREVLGMLSISGYAPRVIKAEGNCLINEYIYGEILYDRYKTATAMEDEDELIRLAKHLSVFMQIFYSMFDGKILAEINFKNYIIKDGRCYGIDFENVSEGMQYSDVAGVVACALVYASGDFSSSFTFVNEFINNAHLEIIDIINDLRVELERLKTSSKLIFDIDYMLSGLMYYGDKKKPTRGSL